MATLSDLIDPEQQRRLRELAGSQPEPEPVEPVSEQDDVETKGTAEPMQIEHKSDPTTAIIATDDKTGEVEAIVSVTGVEDRVQDVIEPGAYTKTLLAREPIGVWSHDDKTWVARAEETKELMPGDPFFRSPEFIKSLNGKEWPAAAGGLLVKARFNLDTPHGKAAYSDVKFFEGKSSWSIGYRVTKSQRNPRTGVRSIKELDLFEFSPVMVGANQHAMTLSVKSLAQPVDPDEVPAASGSDTDITELLLARKNLELKDVSTSSVPDQTVGMGGGKAKLDSGDDDADGTMDDDGDEVCPKCGGTATRMTADGPVCAKDGTAMVEAKAMPSFIKDKIEKRKGADDSSDGPDPKRTPHKFVGDAGLCKKCMAPKGAKVHVDTPNEKGYDPHEFKGDGLRCDDPSCGRLEQHFLHIKAAESTEQQVFGDVLDGELDDAELTSYEEIKDAQLDLRDTEPELELKLAHEPLGTPGGKQNWVDKNGQLPAYIQHIAKDLVEKRGMDLSRAIAVAIGTVKKWARGGGDVKPDTRAKAATAVAEWEALKAKAGAKRGASAAASATKSDVPLEEKTIAELALEIERARALIGGDEEKRKVRTPAGARKYGVPVGTEIGSGSTRMAPAHGSSFFIGRGDPVPAPSHGPGGEPIRRKNPPAAERALASAAHRRAAAEHASTPEDKAVLNMEADVLERFAGEMDKQDAEAFAGGENPDAFHGGRPKGLKGFLGKYEDKLRSLKHSELEATIAIAAVEGATIFAHMHGFEETGTTGAAIAAHLAVGAIFALKPHGKKGLDFDELKADGGSQPSFEEFRAAVEERITAMVEADDTLDDDTYDDLINEVVDELAEKHGLIPDDAADETAEEAKAMTACPMCAGATLGLALCPSCGYSLERKADDDPLLRSFADLGLQLAERGLLDDEAKSWLEKLHPREKDGKFGSEGGGGGDKPGSMFGTTTPDKRRQFADHEAEKEATDPDRVAKRIQGGVGNGAEIARDDIPKMIRRHASPDAPHDDPEFVNKVAKKLKSRGISVKGYTELELKDDVGSDTEVIDLGALASLRAALVASPPFV